MIVNPTAGTPTSVNVRTRVRIPRSPRVTGRSAALPSTASTRRSASAGPLAFGSIWTSWIWSPRSRFAATTAGQTCVCPSPGVIPSRRPSRSRTARIGASSSMTMANEDPLIGVATARTGTPRAAFSMTVNPSAKPNVSAFVPTSWTVVAEPRPSSSSTSRPACSK